MKKAVEDARISEIVELGAVDGTLFYRTFFPDAFRMEVPKFHIEVDQLLDSTDRYVNIQIFRGGAKTTKLRAYTARRIAYGISRTVLFVGKSQDHARASLHWLRNQVEKNALYAKTFGLVPGVKWTDEEMQIVNTSNGTVAWVLARGITGSVRGLNYDDYRPDLIPVDDVVDEENSSTIEQRNKIQKLVHGALKASLAPRSEAPFAKMIILQTPQDFDDISEQAKKDPAFVSATYGCWTEDTKHLPLEYKKSIWPERWPSEELRKEYLSYAATNTLSIFAREYECQLITPERSTFRQEWLQYYGGDEPEPEPDWDKAWTVLAIDPVPPPSEKAVSKNLHNLDFESLACVSKIGGKIFVSEISFNRGHDPNWTIGEFFRLCMKWRVRHVYVETVAYQKTLEWLLREAMKRAGVYYPITPYDDKESKHNRILSGLIGVSSNRQLFIRRSQVEFVDQFIHYPEVRHDDVLEAVAVGCKALQDSGFNVSRSYIEDESGIEDLKYAGACP